MRGKMTDNKDRHMNKMRESVLRVPEMYIGRRWDTSGLYFLLSAIIELAIRPESANLCSELKVIIENDTVLSIVDNGRGLPIEPIRIDESVILPKIEHVFSWILSTNPLPAYYKDFGFLNYLAFVLNVVSKRLQVETYFEGRRYELTCMRGEIVDKLREVPVGDAQNKGTRLTLNPDPVLFPDFKFKFEKLYELLRELKNEFPSINITLQDKRSNSSTSV
jgi:DNA gyrase subunit B